MSSSYARFGAFAISITSALVGALATVLPSYLDDSKQVRELFVLREFRFEIWTVAAVAGLLVVDWRFLLKRDRYKRLVVQLLRLRPAHWFGRGADWTIGTAVVLTLLVVATGTGLVVRDVHKLVRLNGLYLRDMTERRYAQFLLSEARVAQASYDFPRAIKLFQHLEKEFAYYAPVTSSEIKLIQAKINISMRISDAADDQLQRFGYSPEVVQQWAEALLLNPRNEVLRSKLKRALDIVERRSSDSYLRGDACRRVQASGSARTLLAADLKAIQRGLLYRASGADRARLIQPELIGLTAKMLCGGPDEDATVSGGVWSVQDMRSLLDATDSESLKQRAEQRVMDMLAGETEIVVIKTPPLAPLR